MSRESDVSDLDSSSSRRRDDEDDDDEEVPIDIHMEEDEDEDEDDDDDDDDDDPCDEDDADSCVGDESCADGSVDAAAASASASEVSGSFRVALRDAAGASLDGRSEDVSSSLGTGGVGVSVGGGGLLSRLGLTTASGSTSTGVGRLPNFFVDMDQLIGGGSGARAGRRGEERHASPFHYLLGGGSGEFDSGFASESAAAAVSAAAAAAAERAARSAAERRARMDDADSDVDLDNDGDSQMDSHLQHLLAAHDHDHSDEDDVDDDAEDDEEQSTFSEEQVLEQYRARAGYRAIMASTARADRERHAKRREDEAVGGATATDPVHIKKEPVDDAADSSMSDIPSVAPSSPPVQPFNSSSPIGDLPSLLEPDQFMRGVQSQILAGVPATVSHIFTIVEEKLAGLKQLATQKSSGAAAAATNGGASSPTPKVAPGVLAEARSTIEKLRRMQAMIEAPIFATSGSSATSSTTGTTSTSSKSADLPLTDELSAFRAVLVQALLTFLAICQRAKGMQQQQQQAGKGSSSRKSGSASTFPTWFPSGRLGHWQLLICESLYFLESSSALATAAPELSKQLKKILVFLCGGGGGGSNSQHEKRAHRLRDALVFEREFGKIAAIFQLEDEPGETGWHADENGQIRSTAFTHVSNDTLEVIASRVFARRRLIYPRRVQLLSALHRIEGLAKRRSDSFSRFIINRHEGEEEHDDAASSKKKKKRGAQSPTGTNSDDAATISPTPAVDAAGAAAAATPTATASPAATAVPPASSSSPPSHQPRLKLLYLLYLLSVHFQSSDEELPAIMSLLGIVSQYLPQADPDYVKVIEAAKTAELDRALAAAAPAPLTHRYASMPPPASASATAVASAPPLFRSSSGGTVISSLMSDHTHNLMSIHEEKDREEKQSEGTESDGRETASPPTSTPIAIDATTEPSAEEPPTRLAPLFDFILDHRPEYLFGFIHRHLLENGSVSVRAHANSFLFLLWRSLSTQQRRRHFFNTILTSFIDGRGEAAATASGATTPLTSLAFYGAHAREYLSLFHTLIMDSSHGHQPPSKARAPSVDATSTTHVIDDPDCVLGLTESDCSSALRRILDCLSAQSRAFQSHSLLPYYSKLQSHFDLAPSQYYLQSCVCAICNGIGSALPSESKKSTSSSSAAAASSESSWSTMNLKDLASEQKYTHCSRTVKLHSLQTIHQLQLKISGVPIVSSGSGAASASSGAALIGRHRSPVDGSLAGMALKHIRVINIYFTDRTGVELAALPLPSAVTKSSSSGSASSAAAPPPDGNEHWTLARSVQLSDTSTRDCKITFPIGLTASAICIHFADFFENFDAASEGLVCPRCLIPVASRSSQCSRCRETVGQCLRCRAIDYEHPDAFQCGECSHSRHGNFHFLVQCRPSTFVSAIASESQRKTVMSKILALQEKIGALLADDMQRVKHKLLRAYRQGGSRIRLNSESAAATLTATTTTTSYGSKKSKPAETRLDFRHGPSSSIAPPTVASPMRTIYESEAATLHAKISSLYQELQLHRTELFLYLHGANQFHSDHTKRTTTASTHQLDTVTSSAAALAHDRRSVPSTSCYACAKQFLVLGAALLHEVDTDCLLAAHRLGADVDVTPSSESESRSSADLNLLLYFLSHARTSAPNPFVYETQFLQETASKLIATIVRAEDDVDSTRGTHWLETVLEQRIARILHEPRRDEPESSEIGDESNSDLLHSLMTPIYELCSADISQARPADNSTSYPRVFNVTGACARLKLLFRLLVLSLRAGGARSTAVGKFVIRPILVLLVRATQVREADKEAATAATSTAKSASKTPSKEPARPEQFMSGDLSRQSLRNLIASGPRDLDDVFGHSALRINDLPHRISSPSSWSGLVVPPRILSVMTGTGSSGSASQLGAMLFGSSQLPSSMTGGVRRANSGSNNSSPSLQPQGARRSNFQRSPSLHATSPGSSRLGRAGRSSAPGSAVHQPAEPSSSPLPPLSLELDVTPRLTIQSLTNDLISDVRSAWRGTASSSVQLPAWLNEEGESSATVRAFEMWMRNKTEDASAQPATTTVASGSPSLRAIFEQVIDSVFNLPVASSFRVPSTAMDDGAGMDLTTIRSKLAADRYATKDDLMSDIGRLVFHAEVYGGEDGQVYMRAKELARIIEQELAKPNIAEAIRAKTTSGTDASTPSSQRAAEWRRMRLAQRVVQKLRGKCGAASHSHSPLRLLSSPSLPPSFVLRSLLLCPIGTQIRQSAAQLVWNLAFPTHAQTIATMPQFKPTSKKARRRAMQTQSGIGATKSDAPVDARVFAFLRELVDILSVATPSSLLYSKEYFALFSHLLHVSPVPDARFKHFVVVRGLVSVLLRHFERELSEIESEEARLDFITSVHYNQTSEHASGYTNSDGVHKHHALYGLTVLLACIMDEPTVLAHFKTHRISGASSGSSSSGLLLGEQVMSFFLRIRGLMLVHSKWLGLCSGYLNHLIKSVFTVSDEAGKRAMMRAYVFALNSGRQQQSQSEAIAVPTMQRATSNASVASSASAASSSLLGASRLSPPLNPHITIYILEQLCSLIKPPQLEQQCLVTFKKSSTQEEYIRGNMKRTPYFSSSFAPTSGSATGAAAPTVILFRHIKDAICAQLKLDNEENILELLVGGKIVSLDVPVMKMYHKWYAEQADSMHGGGHSGVVTAVIKPGGGIMLVGASPSMSPRDEDDAAGGGGADDDEEEEVDLLADASSDLGGAAKSTVLLAGDLPMTVLYRLTGLDGEATEEKIDSLPDDEKKVEDPEVEFALAGALAESGLCVIVYRLFQTSTDALNEDVQVRLVSLMLKLLTYATNLAHNRRALLDLPAPVELSHRASAVPFCFRVLVDKLILTLQAADSTTAVVAPVAAQPTGSNSVVVPPTPTSPILALSLELTGLLTILLRSFAEQGQSSLQAITSIEQSPEWSIPSQQLQSLLACLALPSVRAHSDLSHQLLSLIPLLSFGQRPLMASVEAHFAPHLDLAAFDQSHSVDATANIEAFTVLAEHIPRGATDKQTASASSAAAPAATPSAIGAAIRDYFFSSGLVQRLFAYLQQPPVAELTTTTAEAKTDASGDVTMGSPVSRSAKKRTRESDEVDLTALKDRASLPYVLRILTGLVHGHVASQSLAPQLNIIRILQSLEGVASTTRVGPLAESLLQSLMLNNAHVSGEIDQLRGTKRQEKKRKALDQRAKMLASMGFKQPAGGGGKAAAVASIATDTFLQGSLAGLEENEHGLKCSVCQEGYQYTAGKDSSRNAAALGFYVYNHQTAIALSGMMDDDESSGGGGNEESVGVTTVTHFNLIHYRCHQEACRADKKLKPPKSEWDGATIRNQHTLCNNLFPILQPPSSVLTGSESTRTTGGTRDINSVMQNILAQARSITSSAMAAASAATASAAAIGGASSAADGSSSALMNPSSPLWDSADIDSSLDQYQSVVEQYWSHISFSHAFSHSRIELVLEDLRTLISRFAMLESFSAISRGGGKESNIQFIPYLIQMAGFLFNSTQTSIVVKERIDQQLAVACQVMGGIDTGARASGGEGGSPPAPRLSFGALPFLDPSIGHAYSAATAPSSSSSSATGRSSPPAPPAGLATVLSRSPLHDLVPSGHVSGAPIRGSIYSDPLDFLEYIMVSSLVFLTRQQWDAIKFNLLWRMIRHAKDGMAFDFLPDGEDDEESKPEGATGTASPAAPSSTAAAGEAKESEQKSNAEKAERELEDRVVRSTQLETLRPIFLFWSLIDSLHSAIAPPTDATYTAAASDAFFSSTTSSWYRRWSTRRSFVRNAQIATFRSILRREHDILAQLTDRILVQYEKQAAMKEVAHIVEASAGVKEQLAKEDFTVDKLIGDLTDLRRANRDM